MVSRPVRDREIAGSNPAFPTTHRQGCGNLSLATIPTETAAESVPSLHRRDNAARRQAAASITGQKKDPFQSIEDLHEARVDVRLRTEYRAIPACGPRCMFKEPAGVRYSDRRAAVRREEPGLGDSEM